MFEIIECNKRFGTYRVRVVVSPTETTFFSFDDFPTQEQVDEQGDKYIKQMEIAAEQAKEVSAE